MRLHVSLLCAALVAHAHSAAIDLHRKLPSLPEDVNKDSVIPLDSTFVKPEPIDAEAPVKDIENNLRKKVVENIPVSVIVDGDVSNPVENEVTPDVKREKLDLEHPGEPQRQEHDAQNAVHYDDEENMVTTVEQSVVDTQNALKQGFQGLAQGIQNWIANNEQLSAIQASINNLQENFSDQINKLNSTLHTFWNNRIGSNPPMVETESNTGIQSIESNLKSLENNFQSGVQALSEGVQVYATLKAENENVNPNPTTPVQTPPNNLFVQYLQLLQNTVTQGFSNVTHAIQNFVTQGAANNTTASSGGLLQSFNNGIQNIFNQGSTTPTGAQGDIEGSTARPTIWQGIQSSLQNILNPGQTANQAAGGQSTNGAAVPNRPIAQAIQNLPFVQGVVSLIQPNRPAAQPAQPAQMAQPVQPAQTAEVTQPGSNVLPVPEKPVTDVKEPAMEPAKEPEKPVEAPAAPAPAAPAAAAPAQTLGNGPIRNIIQNNPIVKGISNAIQRVQASVNNPEKPRDQVMPAKEEVPQPAPQPIKEAISQPEEQMKGHYHNNNAGDNNNSGGVAPAVPIQPAPADAQLVQETNLRAETDKTDKS